MDKEVYNGTMNVQIVKYKDTSFINVTSPGSLELKYLKNNFGFDVLHLEDYVNKTQVPKIELTKNYSLLVLDFPFFQQNGNQQAAKNDLKEGKPLIENILSIPQAHHLVHLPQFTSEKKRRILNSQVDLFIGKDYLVVLHDGVLTPVNDIFSLCQKTLRNRHEYMGEEPVYLAYRIIDVLVDSCFPVMNELSSTIDKIDKAIGAYQSQSTLEDVSITRRNIVVFQTMIKPIIPLFRELEEGRYRELNGTMQPFWGNILDHLQKIWDRLEDSRELIEGISTSNESLLTSKTNEIVMILTIFSAIILPLNLFASIYGMNIQGLPFASENFAFGLLFIFMFAITIGMLFVFKYKRWF